MKQQRVRIAPVSYGYGPVGKAMHIAREIRDLLGPTVRVDLFAPERFAHIAEPGLFDWTGNGTDAPIADLVVAVMNRAEARRASDRGERVIFVDSLAWLWDKPLELRVDVEAYLYQDLPILPVPAANVSGYRNAYAIGAIAGSGQDLAGAAATPRDRGASVVLSLAGMENFETSLERGNVHYPNTLLHALSRSRIAIPEVEIFGNVSTLTRGPYFTAGMTIGSGTQQDFLRAARRARQSVVAPGLTTIVELCARGLPFSLLPPQNYSQAQIWSRFNARGVPGATWQGSVMPWLASAVIPEVVGSQIVRAVVNEAALDAEQLDGDELSNLFVSDGFLPTRDWTRAHIGSLDGAYDVARAVEAILH